MLRTLQIKKPTALCNYEIFTQTAQTLQIVPRITLDSMANLKWTEKLNYALSLSRISLQCKILEMFIKSSRYIQRCKSL